MNARKSALKRRRAAEPRGQAMIEYSIVTHFLLIGGSLALMPVMSKLYEALSKYYESIYAVLNTGAV